MVCHARSASVSSRRHRQRVLHFSPLPPLAVLDLGKPAEREVHDFLCRATSKRARLWPLLDMRRQGTRCCGSCSGSIPMMQPSPSRSLRLA